MKLLAIDELIERTSWLNLMNISRNHAKRQQMQFLWALSAETQLLHPGTSSLRTSAPRQESGLCFGNAYLTAVAGDSSCAVVIVLYHAENRYGYIQFPQHFIDRSQLIFAAVQQDKVGETLEALVRFLGVKVMLKAPAQEVRLWLTGVQNI